MRCLLALVVVPALAGPLLAYEGSPLPPTAADVSYGPHSRNVLDFWKAPGDGPRPLLVNIHGGGWTGGDKKIDPAKIKPSLDRGVSYASINYRLTDQAILPAPVHDAARAIQFLRTKAADWNINPKKIALIGGSAGACSSMWILLHDDLADPKSDDPVLRQSTRVSAAVGIAGQTSIDPKVVEGWVGPKILEHRMINLSVGEPTIADALRNYEKRKALYEEFSPINHLDHDDPPLFLVYDNKMTLPSENASHGIHHPVLGVKMKEKADKAGHECYLLITGVSKAGKYENENDFLFDKLLSP